MERVMRVTPPLALHLNRGRDGNDLRTGESGRRREVSDRVEAERLGAVKADATGGKEDGTASLPEGSDDSAESRGA